MNIEQVQRHLWEAAGISVREFSRSMFTVKSHSDVSTWSKGIEHPLLTEHGVQVKYMSALQLAVDHCPNLTNALQALSIQMHQRTQGTL